MPVTDKLVNNNKNVQLISVIPISPKNPKRDLTDIISKDVATAFFIGRLANKTKAGIIKKPPPAPTIPVSKPTIKPSIIIKE